jgi:hypothetical protein
MNTFQIVDNLLRVHLCDDKGWRRGLGATIGFLNAVRYACKKTGVPSAILYINNENTYMISMLSSLKNVLMLSWLEIKTYENSKKKEYIKRYGNPFSFSDIFHSIVPKNYIKWNAESYLQTNSSIKNNKHKSTVYLALAGNNEINAMEGLADVYPYNKVYSTSYYKKLFTWCKKMNYDVINVDNRLVPIENKVDLLVNYCKFAVTYEGGIASLCHVLGVPVIMLPWSNGSNQMFTQVLHKDPKTYFLKDPNEILKWSLDEQWQILKELEYQQQGNNVFLNGTSIEYNRKLGRIVFDNQEVLHFQRDEQEIIQRIFLDNNSLLCYK